MVREIGEEKMKINDVTYRLASENDVAEIARITFQREGANRKKDFNCYFERTKKELEDIEIAVGFNIIVAEYEGEIIGFGRSIYYDLKKIQAPYPAPSGWYLMGVVVKPEFRRHGIGRRITEERLIRIFKNSTEAYFIVDSNNQASIQLHKELGFKKISEGEGFLKVKFDNGKGYLFKKELG